MRILASLINYPPDSRVGAWLATHEFLAAMAGRGHEVRVCVATRVREPYVLDGVRVHQLAEQFSSWAQKADVIVSHLGDNDVGVRTARAHGKLSVRFVHGGRLADLAKRVAHPVEPTLAVFNSHSLLESSGYTGPSIVCHPPLDLAKHTTTHGDAITLVNHTLDKGAWLFDQLARHLPGRQFLGVRGGYGDHLKMRRPNLTLIAPTRNMRTDVFARTRVLLMPSLNETWGMVGVEAMCSGIPVIAHPTPGLRESLGPAGLFADRDDIDAWLDVIEDLDDPAKYKAQAKRCRKRAEALAADDAVDRFVHHLEALA